MPNLPTALVFYHYLYPDDVVSAIHFAELCQGLAERGWKVTARPCNRGCRDEAVSFAPAEEWQGVQINRINRPRFRQASPTGRILNILWMLAAWSLDAIRFKTPPDVLIIGTDPALSILVAIVWKALRRRTKIVHWCFDLYPEAAFADGLLKPDSFAGRLIAGLMKRAYKACDLIVDIGSCMRSRIQMYGSQARQVTLVPWALEEPAIVLPVGEAERESVFGDACLGLMYSGTYGRAHSCSDLLKLSHSLEDANIKLAFSVRGNRVDALKDQISAQNLGNFRFIPFATASRLQERLACADVHIVSLREEWTGTVVPSKFFGALAIGRPVLFFGSPDSFVAEIIKKHDVGWVWNRDNPDQSIRQLSGLAARRDYLPALAQHCHDVYTRNFSRDCSLDEWDCQLRETLGL